MRHASRSSVLVWRALSAPTSLQAGGVVSTIYEGQPRAGGRCRSLRGFFPGQVAELGGEFIDTQHKTMLGLANRFNLPLEDVSKQPGEETFFFDGVHYTEADVIEQYRVFAPRMRADLKTSSGAPTSSPRHPVTSRWMRSTLPRTWPRAPLTCRCSARS